MNDNATSVQIADAANNSRPKKFSGLLKMLGGLVVAVSLLAIAALSIGGVLSIERGQSMDVNIEMSELFSGKVKGDQSTDTLKYRELRSEAHFKTLVLLGSAVLCAAVLCLGLYLASGCLSFGTVAKNLVHLLGFVSLLLGLFLLYRSETRHDEVMRFMPVFAGEGVSRRDTKAVYRARYWNSGSGVALAVVGAAAVLSTRSRPRTGRKR